MENTNKSYTYDIVYLTEKDSQKDDLAQLLNCKSTGLWKPAFSSDKKIAIVPLQGHLFQTCSPEEFDPKYKKRYDLETLYFFPNYLKIKPKQKTEHMLHTAVSILKQAKEIVIATDIDNEGARIAKDVIKMAKAEDRVLRMIDTSSLTEGALKKALSKDSKIPWQNMAKAAEIRALIDYAEGISLSRALTYYLTESSNGYYPNSLVFGGVKTPLMKMIIDRDIEHESFKERPYWSANIKLTYQDTNFVGILYKVEKEEDAKGNVKKIETTRFFDEEEIKEVLNKVNGKTMQISEIIDKKRKQIPPKLYDFTSLSADIAKNRKMLPDEVLEIAQELYMNFKIQSYPRTEVRYLKDEDYENIPNILQSLKNTNIADNSIIEELLSKPLLKRKTVFDSSKIESHTAIIPTDNSNINKVYNSFNNGDIKKIMFEMVVKRFLANFLPDAEISVYGGKIDIDEDYYISFKEEILIDPGFTILYSTYSKEDNVHILPKMKKGENIEISGVKISKGFTSPPSRYTTSNIQTAMSNIANLYKHDKTIKEFLGKHGIGTTSTRANIISELLKQKYIQIEEIGKKFYLKSTPIARKQIEIMPEELVSPLKRAILSKYISDVVKGELSGDELIESYQQELKNEIEAIKEISKSIKKIPVEGKQKKQKESLGVCPLCSEGQIYETDKTYICSNAKWVKDDNGKWNNSGCSFTIWKNGLAKFGKKKITSSEVKKLLKNKKIEVELFSSKTNKSYTKEIEIDLKYGVKVNF